VCTHARDCEAFDQSIITRNYLDICDFIDLEPIVCCPPAYNEQLTEIPKTSTIVDQSMNSLYQILIVYILYFITYKNVNNRHQLEIIAYNIFFDFFVNIYCISIQ